MASILADLMLRLRANSAELQQGLDKANNNIASFQKSVEKQFKLVGGAIAAAFSIKQISAFIGESAKLASEIKGVEAAFKRIDNSEKVLETLKTATRGTVSEMELMQQAIKASNFNIPMETLAKGLEFATKRAAETGESVDYLVDSFVTGLGRKSVMILDNLGISALRVNEEVAKTGDFMKAVAKITEEELGKMGKVILTDSQKMAQFNTYIQDSKVKLGELALKGIMPLINLGNKYYENLNKQSIALEQEKVALNNLVGAATSANISEEARLGLIKEINSKYPKFLEGLNAEKVTNDELKTALDKVNASYEEKLKLALLQEDIADQEDSLLKNLRKQQTVSKDLAGAKNDLAAAEERLRKNIYNSTEERQQDYELTQVLPSKIERLTEKQNKLVQTYGTELDILTQLNAQLTLFDELLNKQTNSATNAAKAVAANAKEQKTLLDYLRDASPSSTSGAMEIPAEWSALPDITKDPNYLSSKEAIAAEDEARRIRLQQAAEEEKNQWKEKANSALEYSYVATGILDSISMLQEAAMNRELAAAGNNEELKDKIRRKYAKKQQTVSVMQAIVNGAVAVTKALAELGPIAGPIMAGVTAGTVAAQVALIKSQAFADGGIVYGPTMGLVGEYAGARTNPEVIAPLNDLRNILGTTGMAGEVRFVIEQDKLVGILSDYSKKQMYF